jgi:hypothetical protein
MLLNPDILYIENRIIPIDTNINNGEYAVRNRLPLKGNKSPTKEKQAGHTPSIKPRALPPTPDFMFGLQSRHWFFENKYSETNMPNRIENPTYNDAFNGFWKISANQI